MAIGSEGTVLFLVGFLQNASTLLLPGDGPFRLISGALVGVCMAGGLRVILGAIRRDARAARLLILVFGPIVTGGAVAFLRIYPILEHPRYIVWMLPSLYVLLLYAIEPVWALAERGIERVLPVRGRNALAAAVAVLCVANVLASIWFLERNERSKEEVGQAVRYLQTHAGSEEPLFVHGALEQQAGFYMQTLGWRPTILHLGSTGWPCCARNRALRVSDPLAETF